jgi:hypothetical protein
MIVERAVTSCPPTPWFAKQELRNQSRQHNADGRASDQGDDDPDAVLGEQSPDSISPTVMGTKKKARCLIRNDPVASNHETLTTPRANSP